MTIHVLYSHNPYARINEFRFEGLELFIQSQPVKAPLCDKCSIQLIKAYHRRLNNATVFCEL